METFIFKPKSWPESGVLAWLAGLGMVGMFLTLFLTGQTNVLAALVISGALLAIARHDSPLAILLTFVYLFVLGDVRRIVSFAGGPAAIDLLLLINPLLAFYLAFRSLVHLRLSDRLTNSLAFLLLLMVAELFNPRQGSLLIGLSGGLFYLTPMLWFWVGKKYASPATLEKLIYRVIIPFGLLAACLGLSQTFVGFLPWEQAWIDQNLGIYKALYVGGTVRAFSFSVSGAEYTALLTIATCAIIAAFLAGKRLWALALPVILLSIFLASARGPVLKVVTTVAIVWVIRQGRKLTVLRLFQLGVVATVCLGLLVVVASHFSSGAGGPVYTQSSIQDAVSHQIGGLAHPLDEKYSTAGIHTKMIVDGIKTGFIYPIGYGLGSTTMAAFKFGSDSGLGSSEVDFSDTFISLGLIGGLLYLYIAGLVLRRAVSYVREVPKHISLPVFAILLSTLGAWLIGGQYSIASLVFFLIGGLHYDALESSPEKVMLGAPVRSRSAFEEGLAPLARS